MDTDAGYGGLIPVHRDRPSLLKVATGPLFNDLRSGNCEFLLPDDGGEAFRGTFPGL
jgi:hypothetical protein